MLAEMNAEFALSVANLVLTFLMYLALAWIATKTRKIDTLESKLQQSQSAQIDQRITIAHAPLVLSVANLKNEVDGIIHRLHEGEEDFESLGEKGHRIEMRQATLIGDLKEWMTEKFAGKQDLKDHETSVGHKLDQMNQKQGTMAESIAVLTNERRMQRP